MSDRRKKIILSPDSGLTGTSSLFECCPNVVAVVAVIFILEVAFGGGAVVVVVPLVFSRYGFTELFVPVEEFLISDSFSESPIFSYLRFFRICSMFRLSILLTR